MVIMSLIIYILGSQIFLIPVFKKTYNYKITKENYSINGTITFKKSWSNCNLIEEQVITANDELIYNELSQDLIIDGFERKKDKYIKVTKNKGSCKKYEDQYKKHNYLNNVVFELKGDSNKEILVGDNYVEEYVVAKVNGKESKDVSINSNLNENKVGTYVVSYSLTISNDYKQRLYRKIKVIDDEKPNIILNGDDQITLEYGEEYKEPGFSASDNYDGDITSKVMVKNTVNTKKSGTYKITYKVSDSSGNYVSTKRMVYVKEKTDNVIKESPKIEVKEGITYVNGIIIVNKDYSLPKNYDPKVNKIALEALKNMQADAEALGLDLSLISGYRSYDKQEKLHDEYVKKDGKEVANTYSALPGHSEHQTGLAFDIGSVERSFADTSEAKWIEENAHLYGFIVRYPKGKSDITGYIYEPWHVRYLGIDIATDVKNSGLTLEEYLGLK